MSNFWANRLGQTQQQPQAPAAPAPPPAATKPWWLPQQVAPQAPSPTPQVVAPQTVQQVSVDPNGQSELTVLLQQDGYTTTKAQSMKDTETCPNCGSTNYMRASGNPNSMKQCYECGSNPRFEQMAAGTTGIPTKGPVRSARVQNVGDPSFKPMGSVIQHI